MLKVEWDETYSVHVKEMDDQHKRLLEIINDLHLALMGTSANIDPAEAKEKAIIDLEEYLLEHFQAEEKYLQSIAYLDLQKHEQEHRNFILRLQRHKEGLRSDDLLRPSEVMKMLVSWLQDHMQEEDQKYSQFAAAKAC